MQDSPKPSSQFLSVRVDISAAHMGSSSAEASGVQFNENFNQK